MLRALWQFLASPFAGEPEPARFPACYAWDLYGRLWELRAPAWSPGGVRVRPDVVARVKRDLGRGLRPQLPPGWDLIPRERGRAFP